MTSGDVIRAALRAMGVLAAGETMPSADGETGLEAMQMIVGSWAAEGLMVPYETEEALDLTAGTASYTIGSGETWDSIKPERVLGAFVRDSSGYDYPVRVVSEPEYRAHTDKTMQSRPYELYYRPGNTTGTVYLYPTPDDSTEDLYLVSLKTLTEPTGLTTTLAMPRPWDAALKWALVAELAPEYGVQLDQVMASRAISTKRAVKRLTAAQRQAPATLEVAAMTGSRLGCYDIYSDS